MEKTINDVFSRKQLVKMLTQLYLISSKAESLINEELEIIQQTLKNQKAQIKTK